jgi:hypothetical protein
MPPGRGKKNPSGDEGFFAPEATARYRKVNDHREELDAYDRGEIELPQMDGRGSDVILSPTSAKEYSKVQIARFCGMMKMETGSVRIHFGFSHSGKTMPPASF